MTHADRDRSELHAYLAADKADYPRTWKGDGYARAEAAEARIAELTAEVKEWKRVVASSWDISKGEEEHSQALSEKLEAAEAKADELESHLREMTDLLDQRGNEKINEWARAESAERYVDYLVDRRRELEDAFADEQAKVVALMATTDELHSNVIELGGYLADERAAHDSTKEDYHEAVVNFGRERAKVARVRALHRPDSDMHGEVCECSRPWPCPTIAALAGDA